MSKANIAAILGGLFLVALVGFNVLVSNGSEDNPVVTSIRDGETEVSTKAEAEAIESSSEQSSQAAEATESTEAADSESSESTQPTALGVYANYSEAEFNNAVARDDRVVLSFSADWCPTCQALKRNINAGVIPDGLTILELDYDTETEFKQKHGVTFQHTLVEIDGNGDTVKRWAGSRDIDEILAEL